MLGPEDVRTNKQCSSIAGRFHSFTNRREVFFCLSCDSRSSSESDANRCKMCLPDESHEVDWNVYLSALRNGREYR